MVLRSVGLCTLAVMTALGGCRGQAPLAPPDDQCVTVPRDSLRMARHEDPSWSIRGMIAYQDRGIICFYDDGGYLPDPELAGLWILNPATQERLRILPGGELPSWSPDGSKVVVTLGQLFIFNIDDSSLTRIPGSGSHFFPSWSPNGEWIAYDDGWDIWIVRTDGSDARNLGHVSGPSGSRFPSWSPDGAQIVHVRYTDVSPYSEIFVMNTDGTGVARLTHNQTDDLHPVFSPDGHWIAYTGHLLSTDRHPQVWIMEADGSNPKRLTINGGVHPSWSPDGQQLVFSRLNLPCGESEFGVLWTVDVKSGAESQLTRPWPQRCDGASID